MEFGDGALLSSDEAWLLPPKMHACWKARGAYSPLQFVLRLRPDVHRALNSIPDGIVTPSEVSEDQVVAFSTYLHETIHWWQHVGSTSGFLLSLIYPAQSHLNHRYLEEILREVGPIKSLREFHLRMRPEENPSRSMDLINIALNNWHDLEFYRWLITDPRRVEDKVNDQYFESAGHAYRIALGAVIWLLSSTADPDLLVLPDPRKWEKEGRRLRDEKVEGFYYGTSVRLAPIGAREIFEGQARFSQLQYLYVSSGCSATWEDFDKAGMLSEVYVAAFLYFLQLSQLKAPTKFDDPVIGLFLLVCDIAINPAEGIVEELPDLARLLDIHDPGRRFLNLCIAIKQDKGYFSDAISTFSGSEYWEVSNRLCQAIKVTSPRRLAETVNSWPQKQEEIAVLLNEDKTFNFSEANLPVRVFLARFVKLQADKLAHPEFFCWPGIWMTALKPGVLTLEDAQALFEEHGALFVDRDDGDVYPRTLLDRDENAVQKAFDLFYFWVSTYDLTRQWLVGSGDFEFDFGWLTSKYSESEMKAWATNAFVSSYGIGPDKFRIVT